MPKPPRPTTFPTEYFPPASRVPTGSTPSIWLRVIVLALFTFQPLPKEYQFARGIPGGSGPEWLDPARNQCPIERLCVQLRLPCRQSPQRLGDGGILGGHAHRVV